MANQLTFPLGGPKYSVDTRATFGIHALLNLIARAALWPVESRVKKVKSSA
jgi:hypothetical protein